tara:strand:- start:238 stop:450 length:213 start_codon:yes stop_codon:yes gene_type:complete
MESVVFALLLLMNNEIKEARIQDSLSICLKHKREAERQQSDTVTYKCIKSKAELEKNIDGSITIKKLILE